VPTIVLGFIGVESTAVATFEAKTHSDIVYPALFVYWAVYFMYFFLTVAIVISAPWPDPNLLEIFGNTIGERDVAASNGTAGHSFSVTVLVMENLNGKLAGFVNACLIFSVLSAGNTPSSSLRSKYQRPCGSPCIRVSMLSVWRVGQTGSRLSRLQKSGQYDIVFLGATKPGQNSERWTGPR